MENKYDFTKSTEENYQSSEAAFYGVYRRERSVLDYTYHKHYTKERQLLQDKIIEKFHRTIVYDKRHPQLSCVSPLENWIVFTAGPMGAGKGHTMNFLNSQGLFPLDAFVNVDPDAIRSLLPETPTYHELNAYTAGFLTQKEVGYISEILTYDALKKNKNVLVDGSLRDARWYLRYFKDLRSKFPILKVAIINVTASVETVLKRVKKRATVTHRAIPEQYILDTMSKIPESIEILSHIADFVATFNNEDEYPEPLLYMCNMKNRNCDRVLWKLMYRCEITSLSADHKSAAKRHSHTTYTSDPPLLEQEEQQQQQQSLATGAELEFEQKQKYEATQVGDEENVDIDVKCDENSGLVSGEVTDAVNGICAVTPNNNKHMCNQSGKHGDSAERENSCEREEQRDSSSVTKPNATSLMNGETSGHCFKANTKLNGALAELTIDADKSQSTKGNISSKSSSSGKPPRHNINSTTVAQVSEPSYCKTQPNGTCGTRCRSRSEGLTNHTKPTLNATNINNRQSSDRTRSISLSFSYDDALKQEVKQRPLFSLSENATTNNSNTINNTTGCKCPHIDDGGMHSNITKDLYSPCLETHEHNDSCQSSPLTVPSSPNNSNNRGENKPTKLNAILRRSCTVNPERYLYIDYEHSETALLSDWKETFRNIWEMTCDIPTTTEDYRSDED